MQSIAVTYSVAPTASWRYQAAGPWKPKGAWGSAPSVAATTVGMANTSGYPVIAYVIANGATITAIKVNGVTTGVITGPIRLGPGDDLRTPSPAALRRSPGSTSSRSSREGS